MAEAVLLSIGVSAATGLLNAALKKCGDALSKTDSAGGLKSALSGNLKPKLVELQRELEKLDGLLSGAGETGNKLVSPWLKRVKEAAFFADNLLDDISYDQLRRQAEANSAVSNLFRASDGTSFTFRKKIGSKLSTFKSMVDQIYIEAAQIGLKPVKFVANPASYQPPAAMSTDEVRENADASIIVGRQIDEDSIVRELCHTDNNEVLGVIAMVGMSGVGKTVMARKIYYENETVTKIYKRKAWISASQDLNLKRVLDEMHQSLTGVRHNLSNTDAMVKKLQECLQKERYLLVLDDVWNTNEHVWDAVRRSLVRVTDGCTGNKVLVTTQSSEVASVMGASMTHRVEVLSNDDAWALFKGKAFANKSQQQVSDLMDIGERIVSKCGGLPLAIYTLASLLASKERSEWESVERSQVWKLSEGQTKIMPWLLISFNHLPSSAVKQCFAHCSIVIAKGGYNTEEDLIESWIAQGYIQPSEISDDDDSNMVDIGRMFIKSMLANNLLQSNERTEPIQFTMHDLMHDLALYVSMDSRLIIRDSNDLHMAPLGVDHVFIYGNACNNSLLNFPEGNTQSNLRTLIFAKAIISMDLVAQARFLRHLFLPGCGLKEIPSSIGGLKHLRILNLDHNPLEYLPETIGKLYNLRILSLNYCSRLAELPQKVTRLLNLRVIATTEAVHIPKGMGQLTHLTQLPEVNLKARENGGKITELRSLQHLRGEVIIKQLENISSKEEAVGAGLKNKQGITDLMLVWTFGHEDNMVSCSDEEVMELL